MYLNNDDLRRTIIARKDAGLGPTSAVGVSSRRAKAENINRSTRLMWVTATTSDVDTDREVIVPEGCDPASYWLKTKGVFIDHAHDMGSAVATMQNRPLPTFGAGGLQNGWKVQLALLKSSPHAPTVMELAESGNLFSSIEVVGLDFGKTTNAEKVRYKQDEHVPMTIVRTWQWMGLTLTLIPANAKCRQLGYVEDAAVSEQALKALGEVDRLICKGRVRKETADLMGFSALTNRKAADALATQLHLAGRRRMLLVDED